MQGKKVFEYAIIRVMPRVERGEFLNVGVILFCKSASYLDLKYSIDISRLRSLYMDIDSEEIKCHLEAFEKICKGDPEGGPIATLDLPSRFRWLTARRSTMLQSSEVHPGLTEDPAATLKKLFAALA